MASPASLPASDLAPGTCEVTAPSCPLPPDPSTDIPTCAGAAGDGDRRPRHHEAAAELTLHFMETVILETRILGK